MKTKTFCSGCGGYKECTKVETDAQVYWNCEKCQEAIGERECFIQLIT